MAAAVVYLLLGVVVWWHLWSGGIGGSLASGSLDPAADVWWLAWVPHALGQGDNLLFSRAMYYPAGVNLLANTSFLLVGLVLSPVTVAAGPVAAFAVAVVLAPAADALCAFLMLRRYVSWAPACFVGGLLYGFGPFVATDLRYGHLNLTVLVIPPLAVLVMDRILVRRAGSPWLAGSWLALCVVGEFFVSVEMLGLGVVVVLCATVVVLVSRRGDWRTGLGYSLRALATAVVLSATALTYPTWWYLSGPRHFTGAVWGDMTGFAASLASFVQPHGQLFGVSYLSGGNGDFLGVPLLVVLVVGALMWHGDPALRFAFTMVLVCGVLALGAELHVGHAASGVPMPAWLLVHLPVLSSLAASRFGAYLDLFSGWALAVVVGHVRGELRDERAGRSSAAAGAAAVAVAALVSVALLPPWPYPARRLVEPPVLAALARLPAGSVVREYPLASGTDGDGLVWQAEAGLSYAVTAGYAIVPGRGGQATISATPDAMDLVFAGAAFGRLTPQNAASLVPVVRRHAFDDHAAAVVVVRDSAGGPQLESLLARALGPASLSDRSGALWLSPAHRAHRAHRAHHAGTPSASVCRPVSAGGGGSGCAARAGGG
ncbi:MAG TPA: hypothetical protein VK428_02310 [Acidimicrobiales bacterium]|nr:hypothetical protein [Acidimicrobiales bacterium]